MLQISKVSGRGQLAGARVLEFIQAILKALKETNVVRLEELRILNFLESVY